MAKVTVEGGSDDDRTIFYTALYHTMIDPRCFTDVTGEYPGADGKIHTTDRYTRRTVFSGWDVFRSQFPLQTIINPQVVSDMVNSFIDMADENGTGVYDRWEPAQRLFGLHAWQSGYIGGCRCRGERYRRV